MISGKRINWITAILFMALAVLVFLFPVVSGGLGLAVKILVLIGIGGFITYLILLQDEVHGEQHPQSEPHENNEVVKLHRESVEAPLFTEKPFDAEKNFEKYLDILLLVLKDTLVGRTVFVYFYAPESNSLQLRSYRTDNSEKLRKFIPLETGYLTTVFQENMAQSWGDMGAGSPQADYYETPSDIRSCLCAPVRYENHPIGILGVDSNGNDAYGEDDILIIERFAHILSLVVENVEQLDILERKASFFSNLMELTSRISLASEPADLYAKIAAFIREYIPYQKLSCIVFSEFSPEIARFDFVDGYDEDYAYGYEVKISGGILKQILKSEEVFLVKDLNELEYRYLPGDLEDISFQSLLGYTVNIDNRHHGVLILENDYSYNRQQQFLFSLIGKYFSMTMEKLLLFKNMKNLATIDGLTNVYNHRAFKERFNEEIQRSERYGSPLTLLILDLDKFKRINDTYGHLFGDFVLTKTVRLIKASVRTIDTVARYGGEEFAVILINATKENSLKTAVRILNNIADFKYEQGEISERITVSIGMAEYPTDGRTVQELISNADSAMYAAKRKGGNAVESYNAQLNGKEK